MNLAKIKLSPSELSLVSDANFILTKNRIIEKVYVLLGFLGEQLQQYLQNMQQVLPSEIYANSPKIYRGEKYRELPYVMLDYPRCFAKDNAFAIRCFFWWGNHFSITLHLAGKYAEQYAEVILPNLFEKSDAGFFICFSEDQWEHHFEADNFIAVGNTNVHTALEWVRQKKFLKIARRLSFEQWDSASSFFTETNKEMLDLFHSNK